MKKILLWVGVIIIVGLVIVIALRNVIARRSVEIGVSRMTGFPLTIEAVDVGIFDSQLTVSELKLMNPADFEEHQFVDLPKFHLDYRLGSFLTGKPHLNEVVLDLNQVMIVKNAKGESNVQRLNGLSSGGASSTPTESKKHPFQIDVVHLHIGSVTTKDYSRGKVSERTTRLNVDVVYKNITDSTDISRLVLMTIMSQVKLPDIGVNFGDLQKGLGNVQNAAGAAVNGATSATKQLMNGIKQLVPGQ